MKPITRKEIFENAIAHGEKAPIKPMTRKEIIMAKEAKRESKSPGGDCDWNTMKNKPFGETTVIGDTLTWDGNTDGLVLNEELGYKVSDVVPSLTDVQSGGSAILTNQTTSSSLEIVITDLSADLGIECYQIDTLEGALVGFGITQTVDVYERGLYLMKTPDYHISSLTINGYTGFERTETVPLPNKYLDFIETVGGDTLTWDGDTEGLELVEGMMAHVSDAVPTNISSGNFELVIEGTAENIAFDSTSIVEWATGINAIMHMGDMPVVVLVSETGVGVDLEGLSFPKAGTYFCWMESGAVYTTSLTINGYTGFTKTQIKEEYVKDVILAVLEEKGLLS